MDYKEKYEQGLECLEEILSSGQEKIKMTLLKERLLPFFPELKESEDERIRKALITFFQRFPYDSIEQAGTNAKEAIAWLEKQGESYTKKDVDDAYLKGVTNTKNEIEKQYEANYQIRKDIATFIFNYRGDIKDRAKWMDYLGIKVSFVEKQDEKKVTTIDFNAKDWYVSKVDGKIHDMIEDKDAFTNPGEFENSLGHLLKLFEKLPKQDLLDGLKFYTNVVEHDGEYVKPTEWNDEDERMCQETIDWFEKKCFPYALEHENPARESIKWLKSLKERLS